MKAIISAISHFVPPNIIPNSWFEDKLETSDEWIRTRTGIVERRFFWKAEQRPICLFLVFRKSLKKNL